MLLRPTNADGTDGGLCSNCPLRGTITNPGAGSAKEYELKRARCHNPRKRWALGMRRALSKIKTTLGNGYLGSRIDEERSKMRYLV